MRVESQVTERGVRSLTKHAVDHVGLGGPARWLWERRPGTGPDRRFAQWLQEADRLDNDRMCLVLAACLTEASNCIDIGAAGGDRFAEITRLAPKGHHIAYEPLPDLFEILGRRFPDRDVRNLAVSDECGRTDFAHVRSAPGWSGLRAYDVPLAQPDIETIEVRTTRLDDDLPNGYIPSLIKIDVNGAEAQTLRGALRTIATHRPLVLFEHGRAAAAYGTTSDDVFHLVATQSGLRIFDLEARGPFTADGFREAARTHWNFLARP
jgi:FkbM family methyltransferase